MHAIRVSATGGPEVLRWAEVDEPTPGPGDLLVEVAAAGLNYIDTYQRSGLYEMRFPYTPGLEGAGRVVEVGGDVDGVGVGDRVAWTSVIGSYAERVVVPASQAVPVPDGVDDESAAAVMLQGTTAHYLVSSTFPLEPGHRCLVHAAAGGVGLLLVQMAKLRAAEVYATVGSAEKGELAAGAGADHVINYRDEDFGDAVERIGGPRPLHVIYDGVGADTFHRGLEVLARRGMMVTFGNASGPVDAISPLELSRNGSVFLTRPTLGDHLVDRAELEWRTGEIFGWMADGRLDVRIGHRLPLAEAARAHDLLEGRATTGKVILIP